MPRRPALSREARLSAYSALGGWSWIPTKRPVPHIYFSPMASSCYTLRKHLRNDFRVPIFAACRLSVHRHAANSLVCPRGAGGFWEHTTEFQPSVEVTADKLNV